MDEDRIRDLIGAIYEAPFEPQQWTYVIKHIKLETRSRFAHFWSGSVDATVEDFLASPNQYLAFEHDRFSFSEVAACGKRIQAASLRDPHLERVDRAPIGKAFLTTELVSHDEYKRSEFYNEFGKHMDAFHSLASVTMRERRFIDTTNFFRPETDPPYTQRDVELLEVFIPHIWRSLELNSRLQLANAQASLLRNSFDTLQSAIALLKQSGKVIFLNRAAEELIGQCAELYLKRDRLCATSHADCLRLE